MHPFDKTLSLIDDFCSALKIKYAIIGGLALIIHKIEKTTKDIDVTLLINLEDIDNIGKSIAKEFKPLISDSIPFFAKNFVMPVLCKETNIRIDFAAGLSEFDRLSIKRAVKRKVGSRYFTFISIEDLIIYKLFAARDKDLLDLKEIAKVHKEKIDRIYLKDMLVKFAELERTDMEKVFEQIFKL